MIWTQWYRKLIDLIGSVVGLGDWGTEGAFLTVESSSEEPVGKPLLAMGIGLRGAVGACDRGGPAGES